VNAEQAEKLLRVAESNVAETAPALQQVRTNIAIAVEKQKQDAVQAERYKKLLASNSVAKLEYENALLALANSTATVNSLEEQYRNLQVQAQQQLLVQQQQTGVNKTLVEYNRIIAPVGGKIYDRKKQPGDYVRKGDVIALLANPLKIYAELSLDERSMGGIKLGQTATIQLNTDESKTYQSHIGEILPAFDEATRSFLVKAFFDESLDFQITGAQLQANILIGERKNVLVIPRKYLGFGNRVLLPDKKTALVKTGVVSTEWVEILEGLTENQVILTELD
jgi:multidrug resistance efflux pump